jgi:hypothetical protein
MQITVKHIKHFHIENGRLFRRILTDYDSKPFLLIHS